MDQGYLQNIDVEWNSPNNAVIQTYIIMFDELTNLLH